MIFNYQLSILNNFSFFLGWFLFRSRIIAVIILLLVSLTSRARLCTRNSGQTIDKSRPENHIRVVEHAFLQTDHYELAVGEVGAKHESDVLCVREVQGRVHFVQDVHGRWLEQQQRQDQRQRQ